MSSAAINHLDTPTSKILLDFNSSEILDSLSSNPTINPTTQSKYNHGDGKLIHILMNLKAKQWMHSRASEYYDSLNMRLIYPSVVISAISSVASFMSTSDILAANIQNAFIISVGIMTSVSAMMQTITGACGFSTKKEAFLLAADEFDKLITAVEFELELPNEDRDAFFTRIENSILGIQDKCKYLIPLWIQEDYKKQNIKSKLEDMI